jgi:hypothetical protein
MKTMIKILKKNLQLIWAVLATINTNALFRTVMDSVTVIVTIVTNATMTNNVCRYAYRYV